MSESGVAVEVHLPVLRRRPWARGSASARAAGPRCIARRGARAGGTGDALPAAVRRRGAATLAAAAARRCAALRRRIARRRLLRGSAAARRRAARDHWTEQPAPWVGGVCDRGVGTPATRTRWRLAAGADGRSRRSSSATASPPRPTPTVASLAAARAARDVLARRRTAPPTPRPACEPRSATADEAAADAAADVAAAVADQRRRDRRRARSSRPWSPATVLAVGWVGDCRAYWLPDGGAGPCSSPSTTRRHRDDGARRARAPRPRPVPRARDHPLARGRLTRPAPRTVDPGPRRPRLGAGLLRRPVELLLERRRRCADLVAAPGDAPADPPAAAPAASSPGPTSRAATTTSPSRSPASDRSVATAGCPDRHRTDRGGRQWPSSTPRCSRTSSSPTAPPTSTRSSR